MFHDYVELGTAPINEDCVNVGQENYEELVKDECNRFKELLVRMFGEPPVGATYCTKSFPHDFGTYYEVCVKYDVWNKEAEDFAYLVQDNLPETWGDNSISMNLEHLEGSNK